MSNVYIETGIYVYDIDFMFTIAFIARLKDKYIKSILSEQTI